MSYRKDQIKLLDLVCSHMLPADFIEDTVEVTVYEDELKKEGFSYNEAINLIKEMYEVIPKLNLVTSLDHKRGFCASASSSIYSLLKDLKYPDHELGQEYYEQISSGTPTTVVSKKISITIDSKKGIYRIDNPKLCYPLGNTKKRMKLIKYLISHEYASLKALMTKTGQEKSAVITSINAINDMIIKKLETRHDFILHLETGGYAINKEDFEIKDS